MTIYPAIEAGNLNIEFRWYEPARIAPLRACPNRLELVTIGDESLHVVDAGGAKQSEIADGAAERDGISLASVWGGPTVHGVSG